MYVLLCNLWYKLNYIIYFICKGSSLFDDKVADFRILLTLIIAKLYTQLGYILVNGLDDFHNIFELSTPF